MSAEHNEENGTLIGESSSGQQSLLGHTQPTRSERAFQWLADHRLARHTTEAASFVVAATPLALVIIEKVATGKPLTARDTIPLAALAAFVGVGVTGALEGYTMVFRQERWRSYRREQFNDLERRHEPGNHPTSRELAEETISFFDEPGVVRGGENEH